MFEELEAHQEKAMAHEGSLKCEYKSYFFPELISLSVEEARARRRLLSDMISHETSRTVTYLSAKSYICLRRVIFIHGG